VTQVGGRYSEAYAAMQARAQVTGATVVHAYDQSDVVTGQGTLGRELGSQLGALDAVFVAVGGGGLIAGVAGWYGGRTRVIGVEPESCATMHEALRTGQPVDVPVSGIAADSLGATRIGTLAFEIASRHVERVILVSDEEILRARRWLWQNLRVATGPGGAATFAALQSGRHDLPHSARVAVIVCGVNTDPTTL